MTIWELVSTLTKTKPLVSVTLNTTTTVHIERYFVNSPHIIAPPLPATGMMVHLSGAKITAGSNKNTMREFIPSQSMVLPYNLPSEWYSCGAVDIAIFYFLDTEEKQAKRLQNLVSQQPQMHGLNNPLVHSLAMRIVEKLQRGSR
ncbi:hypothetical protein ACO0K0_19425 [Undibacterium sp. SXout11W]|uniref:hypothetical protein n=1 Tax=Undibacterium sp. SXout11W TaxID=3413050 RepID=UPI003BF4217D